MRKEIVIGLFLLLFIAVGYLLFSSRPETKWQQRVDHYGSVADSLKRVVDELNQRVNAKDSMLVVYMQTLNRTLDELDKENRKNVAVINSNEILQKDILEAYCKQMADIQMKPDFCK
jgi:hypothetical protein